MRALRLGVLLTIAAALAAFLVLGDDDAEEPSEEDRIAAALVHAATTANPSVCRDTVTVTYLEQRTGYEADSAVAECTERGIGGGFAESVSVSEIEIDGDRAVVSAAISGGSLDGATLVVAMVEDDGWRLDRFERLEDVDRSSVLREYRRELTAAPYRFERAEADCIVERTYTSDMARFEQELIEPDPVAVAATMVGCGRPTVERLLADHLERENVSARARACVLAAAANASDSRLARLYGDPSDLAGIWYGCGAS